MATPNAVNTDPARTTTEVSDGARTAFQNKGAALLSELGLRDGGFQANAGHVFMLDDTGKLVAAPPYDPLNDNGMTAAAQEGRLYVLDGNFRYRQVQLEGNEDEGFTFKASDPLRLKQLPSNSISYMDYFINRFLAIFDDFLNDMSKIFNDMKSNLKKDSSKFFNDIKNDMKKLFGGGHKEEQAEHDVEAAPLIPEDEILETQQTVSTLKEEQPTQSALTTEELLDKNPTKQTTPEFERYLKALADRGNGRLVDAALDKEAGKPDDYYEALAQELEGQVARRIRDTAPSEQTPEARNLFLEGQKHIVATISKDLRGFVREKVGLPLVENFYAQDLNARSSMRKELQEKSTLLQKTGVNEYLNDTRNYNEEKELNKQQTVGKETKEIKTEKVKEVSQTQNQIKGLG